ncbi:MAG: alpha-amylase family glycosyl hydrolase, partial [Gaiellaceae bacterium]
MGTFRCTYRLQLTGEFGFRAAREVALPYLRKLGVSHLYLSPVLQARSDSAHGYDVGDPTRVSEALGGEEELLALCRDAREAGLGIVLDVVPNHMAASDENPSWRDPDQRARVFDWDPDSGRHRRFFDIGELAGVRVEDPDVFEETHRKPLELVADGLVDGLRVDHPDGLANPREYLERLRDGGVAHVWVEKILEPGEQLRDWPVEGTTGYE